MNKKIILLLLLIQSPVFATAQLVEVRASYQTVSLTGFTRPQATVRLVSEEKGYFKNIDFDVGDLIDERQRFGCLDATFIDLDIAANKAHQEKIRADLNYFSRQRKRVADLVSKNTSSAAELDNLSRQEKGAKADLKVAEVQLRVLQERKKRHCIAAKQGWAVTERLVDPGQWVNVGDPLGEVADFSVLLVPFALSPTEFKALKAERDQLRVRLIDEDIFLTAKIARIHPGFDEASRKISVELSIEAGVPEKRGGLRVELSLQLPDRTGAVLVPVSAVTGRYEQHWVKLSDDSELAVTLLGEITEQGKAWARILSDQLKAGDQVQLLQ